MKSNINKIYRTFKLYIENTSWIILGKILQLSLGVLTSIIVARYLGPENFGILAYALSLVSIFSVLGHMGLSGFIVREIVIHPNSEKEILGTALALKASGFFVGFIFFCCFIFSTERIKNIEFWVLMICASSLLVKPAEVFNFWFEAFTKAKYTTIAQGMSLVATSFLQVLLVLLNSSIIFFAFTSLFQGICSTLILLFFYNKTTTISIWTWTLSLLKAKQLMSQTWFIFLGSIFGMIYLKIDQMMIKWLISTKDVGIYAIAANISEIWYFLPAAIVSSFFPKLLEIHTSKPQIYKRRMCQILDLLFCIALFICIITSIMAKPMINFLYGSLYQASGTILIIHIWASPFIFMRALLSKWILIENVPIFSLITQGSGAITNIGFNLILIPKYSGTGAAIATLIAYAVASYFSLLFHKKTRPIFWMMSCACAAPILYVYKFILKKP